MPKENPIKAAVCFADGKENSAEVVARMAAAQELNPVHDHRVVSIGSGAAAVVFSKAASGNVALQRTGSNGNLLIITGVPIATRGDLDQRLVSLVDGDYRNAARELAELDGAYAALFWDHGVGKLVIVTDILGMQPLYVSRRPGVLLLASEMKG